MRASPCWNRSLSLLLVLLLSGGCLSIPPDQLQPTPSVGDDDDATSGDDDDTTTGDDDDSPGDDDDTSGDDDDTSGDDDDTSGDDDDSTGDDDDSPGDDDDSPGDDDDSSPPDSPTGPPDADGDGVPAAEDCDDNDPTVSPRAPELCNGRDDDCDEAVDEGFPPRYYPDQDGDGFGDSSSSPQSCLAAGLVSDHNDCDDGDAAVHPTLVDVAFTGSSPDGGAEAPFPRIQAAIDAHAGRPAGCALILVRRGVYDETVEMRDIESITLRSLEGPLLTLVQPTRGGGRPMLLTGAADVTVEGFSFTGRGGSVSGHGGGVLIDNSTQITLRSIIARDNSATGNTSVGGGVAVLRSQADLEAVQIIGNRASYGGGLGLDDGADVRLESSFVEDNEANSGGGVGISAWEGNDSRIVISSSSLVGNQASIAGGGAYAYGPGLPRLDLEETEILDNYANDFGGGVYNPSSMRHCFLQGNTAVDGYGGGVAAFMSTVVKNSIFLGNSAPSGGGAIGVSYLPGTEGKNKRLENLTLIDNLAEQGSSVFIWDWSSSDQVRLVNVIGFGGTGSGLYVLDGSTAKLEIFASNFYGQSGSAIGGELDAEDVLGVNGNISAPPAFVKYNPPTYDGADFHLQTGSPGEDAGWSEVGQDPDGSPPDMGAYGGPLGAW